MNENMHWTGIWGNAISIGENRPEHYAKNITLCYKIHVPFDVTGIKLKFDNYCGRESITLSKVVIVKADKFEALAHSPAVTEKLTGAKFYPVTFAGKTEGVMEAGGEIISDAVEVSFKGGEDFEVRFYLADFTEMRSAVFVQGPLSNSNYYMIGDQTEAASVPIEIGKRTHMDYFLTDVLGLTDNKNRTLVCYGDSITAQDWPDYLQLKLEEKFNANGEWNNHIAVTRKASSGTRILREYADIVYESYGLKGERRFEHEMAKAAEPGDMVIIQHGINDIIHPVGYEVNGFRPTSDMPTAEEMEEGIKYYLKQCRDYGYKVYLGALLPIEGWRTFEPFRDVVRQEFNNWMKTTDLADGYIDFDAATRGEENPIRFAKEMDSGDHLHPSARGYEAMAEEVVRTLFDN